MPTRKLAAILSADVVGYSRLMSEDERATLDTLTAYREVMGAHIGEHGGRVVDAPGDALLAEFASAVEAVRCAAEIQRELQQRNALLPERRHMLMRIGVNLGDVIEQDGALYGDGVNIAARLQALAEGGGVCVSGSAYDQVEGKLPLAFRYAGEQTVKNIAKPVRAYHVVTQPRKEHAQPALRRRRVVTSAAALALAIVVAIACVVVYLWPLAPEQTTPSVANRNRIAVLPFANISADPRDEYFADGMTEELISRLSRISGLEVIARTSVMKYKGAGKDIAEIGRELNVASVLEGSVRKAPGKVRITAQLISVGNQAHLWSEDYDRQLEDVFAIQSDIAKRVAEALRVRLAAGEQQRIERKGTSDLEAHEWYLKGLYQFHKQTPQALEKAREHLQRAVEKDPAYAQAHAWLGICHDQFGFFGLLPMKEVLPRSRASLTRALELDDTLAEAHGELAMVMTYSDWDWARAETGHKRAIALNPSSAYAHDAYSIFYLSPMGRLDEAIAEMRRAVELDPLSALYHHDLAWIFNHARRWDQAIEQFRRVLEMEPEFSNAHRGLVNAYANKGMFEQAFEQSRKELELTGGAPQALAHLGWAYALAGRRDKALETLDTLKQRARRETIDPLGFAFIHAALGDNDAAFEWLRKASEDVGVELLWAKVDARFDPLRSDPRFGAFLKEIGLNP